MALLKDINCSSPGPCVCPSYICHSPLFRCNQRMIYSNYVLILSVLHPHTGQMQQLSHVKPGVTATIPHVALCWTIWAFDGNNLRKIDADFACFYISDLLIVTEWRHDEWKNCRFCLIPKMRTYSITSIKSEIWNQTKSAVLNLNFLFLRSL